MEWSLGRIDGNLVSSAVPDSRQRSYENTSCDRKGGREDNRLHLKSNTIPKAKEVRQNEQKDKASEQPTSKVQQAPNKRQAKDQPTKRKGSNKKPTKLRVTNKSTLLYRQ